MSETFLLPPKIASLIGPLYRCFSVVCSKLMIMLPQTPFCFGESNLFCILFGKIHIRTSVLPIHLKGAALDEALWEEKQLYFHCIWIAAETQRIQCKATAKFSHSVEVMVLSRQLFHRSGLASKC